MVLQHCIGRGGNFKNTYWNSKNILSLIVWNLQKRNKNKQQQQQQKKTDSMHAVSNNLNLVMLGYAPSWT